MICMRLPVIVLLFFSCFLTTALFSQKAKANEKFFAYDSGWNLVGDIDKATFFSRIQKVNDTCWVVNNYNMFGPMISKEVYKDEDNKIAHGTWIFYKPNGYMDSICTFRNNLAHGSWYFTNDTNRVYLQKKFENGRLKEVIDFIKRDSVNKAKGNTESTGELTDVQSESEFPGGGSAWARYLNKNFRYPERAIKSRLQGEVGIQFIVNLDGKVEDVEVYKSVEYSLDDEARRLIDISPRWTPAIKDGKKIKTYKRQPVVFRIP